MEKPVLIEVSENGQHIRLTVGKETVLLTKAEWSLLIARPKKFAALKVVEK